MKASREPRQIRKKATVAGTSCAVGNLTPLTLLSRRIKEFFCAIAGRITESMQSSNKVDIAVFGYNDSHADLAQSFPVIDILYRRVIPRPASGVSA